MKAFLRITRRLLLLIIAAALAVYGWRGWYENDVIYLAGGRYTGYWVDHIQGPGCFFVAVGYSLIALLLATLSFQSDDYSWGDNSNYDLCLLGLFWGGVLFSLFGFFSYPEAIRAHDFPPPALHSH